MSLYPAPFKARIADSSFVHAHARSAKQTTTKDFIPFPYLSPHFTSADNWSSSFLHQNNRNTLHPVRRRPVLIPGESANRIGVNLRVESRARSGHFAIAPAALAVHSETPHLPPFHTSPIAAEARSIWHFRSLSPRRYRSRSL